MISSAHGGIAICAGRRRAVVKRVLIASHRGYCAGVERAVETVERALEIYGPPVYVRKQIVHNTHVVGDLQARGAIFVESRLEGRETVGLTSGASAPEKLLVGVCDWFRAHGVTEIAPFASRSEDVSFKLPVELSREAAHAAA